MNETVLTGTSQRINLLLVALLHIVAAGTFVVLPLLFFGPRTDEQRMPPQGNGEYSMRPPRADTERPASMRRQDFHVMQWHSVIFNVVLVGFFYVNMYILIPRVLARKNWTFYAGSIVLCFIAVLLFDQLIGRVLVNDGFRPGRPIHFGSINFLLVFGLSTALRLTSDRIQFERDREQRENENLKSELSLLRSQVSPHFMFNVLNSLASLARKKSDKLEPVIIQLSQLMRYMLYDAGEKRMTINREIEYLRNYIDLQELRFGNDIHVTFTTDVRRGDVAIESMLLIPFVENAFKHGTGLVTDPTIDIQLTTDDRSVNFVVKNKYSDIEQARDVSSGIGIQNVRRRLDLLYKHMHELNLRKQDGWFVVELNLKLK